MNYVALLRGINIGGRNKVVMSELKVGLERAGLSNVSTYINSGNILFSSDETRPDIVATVGRVITELFGLDIKVLLRSQAEIRATVTAMKDDWHTDATSRYDVMFLWDDVDNEESLKLITVKPEIESVEYVPGAFLWRVHKKDYGKSGVSKIVGTHLYKHMTVRNSNTARKLDVLLAAM